MNVPLREYLEHIGERIVSHVEGSTKFKCPDTGRWKRYPVSDYHRYFVVPELGDRNGRIHFHVLHFCRDLPP